jgi:carbon monoxide dehydrogenase subunit G
MAIEMDNSFTVPVPPEQAWDVLLDVERIAPCMPGASVTSVDGDEMAGQVKVKLGPLSLTYKGTAKFIEKDQASHTIGLDATGKETRGAGTASANVQAVLKPGDTDGTTLVTIHTSLNVTGKPAQFGRSLLPEVSGKLIDQFATNLEAMINTDSGGTDAEGTAADAAPGIAVAAEASSGEAAPLAAATVEDAVAAGAPGAAPQNVTPAAPAAKTVPVAKAAPVAKQEDSLNAFTFIVIPVLKRAAPFAAAGAAGAAIALVVRRLAAGKAAK